MRILARRNLLFDLREENIVKEIRSLPDEYYYLTANGGRHYHSIDEILEEGVDFSDKPLIQLHFRLYGGKGGFGSILRSFRIHRSTNQTMCRNLEGRRLADVKEEERLRKWIAKKAEREKFKEQKKQEKYERLKKGGPKHEFNDPQYFRQREMILEQVEDAVEAGIAAAEDKQRANPLSDGMKVSRSATFNVDVDASIDEASDSDSSLDFDLLKPSTSKKTMIERKRGHGVTNEDDIDTPTKKQKINYTCDVIFDYFLEQQLEDVAESILIEYAKEKSLREQNTQCLYTPHANILPEKSIVAKAEKHIQRSINGNLCEFAPIDLENYTAAKDLERLGLDHLRHALETRGLKCGGTLEERAFRLFFIKGLTPEQYPKNIRSKPVKK